DPEVQPTRRCGRWDRHVAEASLAPWTESMITPDQKLDQDEVKKMAERLYLDDIHVGQRFTSGSHTVDEDQITRFAREFDPQPFHLDRDAAKATLFEGLAA